MSRSPHYLRQGLRTAVHALGSILLWTLWGGLTVTLAAQIYVLFAHELSVPGFLLRRFERTIAESGVVAKSGRTLFDPTGRLLIEDAQLSLPEFPDPVIRVRAAYVRMNPWALFAGRFEATEVRLTGVSASVPAMLSASGTSEEIVHELDATLLPAGRTITIAQLSGRIAGVAVSAHGAIAVPRRESQEAPSSPIAEIISTHFPRFCRQVVAVKQQLDTLEEPELTLELSPSDIRTALVDATLDARSFTIRNPLAAHIRGLRIVTRLPLIGDAPSTSTLQLTADELQLPLEAGARGVHATLVGRFLPGGFQFEPRELQVTAEAVESSGFVASAFSAQLLPQPLPQLEADVVAQIMGAPMAVRASVDFSDRHAVLRFAGAVSPEILTPLSARLHTDVRKYFDFQSLDCLGGEARLGPGWKFEQLTAQLALKGINAYHVAMEEGRATIELSGTRFYSPDAFARIGENFARGTYEHDLKTHQYRFLLQGRLRPLDISGWFHDWWPNFFRQLEFPASPPLASVDVAGFWREGRRSTVFVFADAVQPVIRSAAFDRVRTRLFIRPTYFEGIDVLATRDGGAARGTFTYVTNPVTHGWDTLDLDVASNVDPALAAKIIGPAMEERMGQFKYARAPELKVKAHITGAEAEGGAHQAVQIQAKSRGEFRVHDFPLEDVSFNATVRDDEIAVEDIAARFASGAALGRLKATGTGKDRRLGFTLTLQDASLGQFAETLQTYSASLNHRPPPAAGKFVQAKENVRLDLAAVAEGRFDDPFSYQGDGSLALRGEGIGEVPLLGALSSLLKFTTLRFTSANARFKINATKIEFGEVALRGANSTIDAHGEYALDRKELDFKAKVFPFQESNNIFKSVVGVVLTPISSVFEVKLTGSLDKPEWAFAIGPTSLIRSMGEQPAETAAKSAAADAGATPAAAPGETKAAAATAGPPASAPH